ncbi:MAG: folylpolyglutamate synthase/dihydrofolate synthase family protein [Bacteroidales bacterium]
MNYESCLDFLYGRLPMFQHQGKKALRYDLSNITRMCAHFHDPHKEFKSIHIAGTNGKGSVSHQLASILQSAGYRVGLYTSPHLVDFRERIRIDGQMISREYVTDFIGKHMHLWEEVQPSFFELTTLMAFVYFAESRVDVAVIETGLGGRLDSTNVIRPLLSVITNISFDHTDILGNTLAQIAFEKAGIIKSHVLVVIGETHEQTLPVFKEKAASENAPLLLADAKYEANLVAEDFDSFAFELREKVSNHVIFRGKSDLIGRYQLKNVVTSYCAVEMLQQAGLKIPHDAVVEGFSKVKEKTGLMGRYQVVHRNPLIICDTAHNPSGIAEVARQLSLLKPLRLHIVLGFSADKDVNQMLKIFAQVVGSTGVTYYFTSASVKRSMDAHELADKARMEGIAGMVFGHVAEAFEAAMLQAAKDEIIFVGGSNFVVGDFLKYFIR